MTDESVEKRLQRCTVRLSVAGGQGTGFFVASRLLLTCAHVVKGAGSQLVDVYWQEQDRHYKAEIAKLIEEAHLDLALLRLDTEMPNHPCVHLDQSVPDLGAPLYSYGYPKSCPDGDSVTLEYEGESFKGNSPLYKLKAGLVDFGFSGSALLNQRTGKVCGIVNLSRNPSIDIGGRAVPVKVIFAQFPELAELNQQLVAEKAEKQDYIYDVFLSYRRRPPVFDWVHNHFLPMLKEWLPLFMPYEPLIFIDEQPEIDTEWSDDLRSALKMSRCLLSIWAPDYFRSPWCLAELHSIRERERLLGLRTSQNPFGLIYPVVFCDGENFPSEFQRFPRKDLRQWNCPHLAFKNTEGIVGLNREVQSVAEELAQLIQKAPDWRGDWPIVTPTVNLNVTNVKLPRFR
jgi:hypothetical protein